MKKLRFLFLTLLLSAMSVNMFAQVAGDRFTKTLEDGITQMEFVVLSNIDRVGVVGCTTTASEVTVPQTIMNGDRTYNVYALQARSGSTWSSCITEVNIPEGVKSLEWGICNGAQLDKIEIPASVTAIRPLAFLYLSELTEITVRSGNTKFEAIDGILYSKGTDRVLKCVPQAKTFEDGVLTIAEGTKTLETRSVFNNQTITKIVFPSTMTSPIQSIDSNNYYSIGSCNYLAEVEVAEGNTNMYVEDNVVFANDENKTLLYFPPARVNQKNAEGKTIYTVPNGVKAIGDFACIGARFQILGLNEVETIGESAFYSCNSLTGVSLSQNMSVISEGAFRGGSIENFYMDGELTGESDYFSVQDGVIFSADKSVLIQFPLGRTGAYEIPAGTTKEIGGYAFALSKLSYITIPGSVTTIDDDAFSALANVRSIVIPEGVTSIGVRAFRGCKFEEVSFPSTLEEIGGSAFHSCSSLKTVNFAEGLKKIGGTAFCNCAFTELTLPKSLISMGTTAIYSCQNLEKVTFADNSELTAINERTFFHCNSLKKVDFGANSSLTTIGTGAFADLPALEKITIPASVTTIGARAFANTPSLTTVIFEEGSQMKIIGAGAFADCGLKSFEIPDAVTTIEREAFRNCNVLYEVTLSKDVSSVSPEAFKYCTKLTYIDVDEANTKYSSVQGFLCNKAKTTLMLFPPGAAREDFTLLPPSLTKIGEFAFYSVDGLTNICIPANITGIEKRAFGLDTNLNSVAMLGDALINPANISQNTETNKNLNAFDDGSVEGIANMFENITLYLTQNAYADWNSHKGSGDAYDTFYSQFADIKSTFTVPNPTCEGVDEFLPVSRKAANLLSTTVATETYVVPTQAVDDALYYDVNLIGDYAFRNASPNIKEVVMKSKVGYIGANAFVNDAKSIKQVVFTNENPADYLSTVYFGIADTYNEFTTDQKIYVRADALDAYKEAWAKYADQISCDIPLGNFAANGAKPFSREFDVDLVVADGKSPVLAYVPDKDTGLGRDTESTLIEYILMKQLSAKVGGTTYKGTYVPAGTPVLLRAAKKTNDAYYRIGTKNSTAPVTSALTGALYDDQTTTVSADAYGYYTLNANGAGTRVTGQVTIDHNSAFLDASELLPAGIPCEKATLLYEAPSTDETILVMNDADDAETVTMTIDYTGPIMLSNGLGYTDYNDIPTPGQETAFKRSHASDNVTFIGNVTKVKCDNQKVEEITSLSSGLTELSAVECGLKKLDVTDATKMTNIYCQNNHLTQLDLSKNTKLVKGTISPQNVSGYLIVNDAEMICLKNDEVGETYELTEAVNDYEYPGGEQAMNVATNAKQPEGYTNDLSVMIVNADAGRAHVQKISSAGAATLYLDFAVDIPEGVEAFYCGGIDNDLTYLYNIENAVQANQGFLTKGDEGWYVWNAATSEPKDLRGKNIFQGTLTEKSCDVHSVLTLGHGKKYGRLGFNYFMGNKLAAFRSYIPVSELDSYAKAYDFFELVFDQETTGIDKVKAEAENGNVYDLTGRKVNRGDVKNGFYIVNGRKVIINK